MKTFQCSTAKLFITVIACSLAAGATTQAGADSDLARGNARLTVRRAADFGTHIGLKLYIDGYPVSTLALNEGYEAIVRPGAHVLSITTIPDFFGTHRSNRSVTMVPGQSYTFTALWMFTDHASLETPETARHFMEMYKP
jgi:hypothetical protein